MKTSNIIILITLLLICIGITISIFVLKKQLADINKPISNNIDTEIRVVGNYDRLVLSGVKAKFEQTQEYGVHVTASDYQRGEISTWVEGNSLMIFADNNLNFDNIEIDIKAPNIEVIELDMSSLLDIEDTLRLKNLHISSNISSKLNACIMVEDLHLETSKASSINICGKAQKLYIKNISGSKCNMENFVTEYASVYSEMGAYTILQVSDLLDVDISSGSKLKYIGVPQMGKVKINSGAKLKQIK
jgi:hypothetical protein